MNAALLSFLRQILARAAVHANGPLRLAGMAMARTSAIGRRLKALTRNGWAEPLRRNRVWACGLLAVAAVAAVGSLDLAQAASNNPGADGSYAPRVAAFAGSKAPQNSAASTAASEKRSDLYGDPLPAAAAARLGTSRFRVDGAMVGMAFAGDTNTLVILERGGLRLEDPESGRLLRQIPLPKQEYKTLDVSRDGRLAAAAGFRYSAEHGDMMGAVVLVDLESGRDRSVIEWLHAIRGTCDICRFSPDGKVLATGCHTAAQGIVTVWDVETGEQLAEASRQAREISGLDFSPDGELLAATGDGATLWAWRSGHTPAPIRQDAWQAAGVRFSPDGKFLAIGNAGSWGNACLWELRTRKTVHVLRPENGCFQSENLTFTPDGKYVVLPGDNAETALLFWDTATGEVARRLDTAPILPRNLTISRDGRFLAACNFWMNASRVKMWDLVSGEELGTQAIGHEAMIESVCFSPDGKMVVTAALDNSARRWNAADGSPLGPAMPCGKFPQAAISPDGKWIAASGLDDSVLQQGPDGKLARVAVPDGVRLWDAATGKELHRLPGHGQVGGRCPVAFSADGRSFCTWGRDLTLRVCSATNGKTLHEWDTYPSDVVTPQGDKGGDKNQPANPMMDWRSHLGAVRFSANGEFFVLQHSTAVHVFKVEGGKQVQKIAANAFLKPLAITHDGQRLAMAITTGEPKNTPLPGGRMRIEASRTNDLAVFDTVSGKEVLRRPLPDEFFGLLAFSPDGKRLAVAMRSPNNRIEILDAATGHSLHTIQNVPEVCWGFCDALAFSPSGQQLACGMQDTSVLIWDLPTDLMGLGEQSQ